MGYSDTGINHIMEDFHLQKNFHTLIKYYDAVIDSKYLHILVLGFDSYLRN
jgi:hypothetical protein